MAGTVASHSPIDKALALQARGFHVFPCNDDKSPACPHGHLDATDDPLRIKMLFAGAPGATLVGISCPASHIHVLDIDPQGLPFYEQHKHLVPDTVRIPTRRGGLHLPYRADDESLIVKNGAGGGIDVRSGNAKGGYIIAWGEAYQYDLNRMSPEWPEAFVSLARAQPKTNGHTVWLQPPTMPSPPASSGTIFKQRLEAAKQFGQVPNGEQDEFCRDAFGFAAKAVEDGVVSQEEALAWCGRLNRLIKPGPIKDFAGKAERMKLCDDAVLADRHDRDDGGPLEMFPVGVTARARREFAQAPPIPIDPFEGIPGGQTGFGEPLPLDQHPLAQFVDMDAVLGVPEYLLPEFMGVGLVTVAGARGKGKTTALVSVGLLMAGLGPSASQALIPPKDRWRNVVYVTEDVRQVRSILHMQEVKEGLDGGLIRARFKVVEAARMSAAKFIEVGELYERALTRWVPGADGVPVEIKPVVIVDTKSACFDVEDEDSNTEASKIAALIKQRFRGLPCVMIGHVRKADHEKMDELTMRGAGAMEADANQCLYLIEKADGTRCLVRGKTRFEGKWLSLEIETSVAAVSLVDRFKDTVTVQVRWGRVRPMAVMPGAKAGKVGPGHIKLALKELDALVQKNTPPDAASQSTNNRFSHILMRKTDWSEAMAKKVVLDLWAKGLVVVVSGGLRQKGAKHAPRDTMALSEEGKDYLSGAMDFQEDPFSG